MSKVISFRMNPDNPREAEALSILHLWLNQGFNTRQTITEALLKLGTMHPVEVDFEILTEISDQLNKILDKVACGSRQNLHQEKFKHQEKLSDVFAASIIKSVKPSVKLK